MATIPHFDTDTISMESVLRTPYFAWKNWGVDYREDEFEALIKEIRNVSRAITDVDKSKKS